MQNVKLMCFCLFLFVTICYPQISLQKQFEQAFDLARNEWRYTNLEAINWAQQLLEKKAVFSSKISLLQQYRQLLTLP